MNTTPLGKYLHDHLAGAAFAVDLLGALARKHEGDALSKQLHALLAEIVEDRDELATIVGKLDAAPGGMKESVARFFEKLSRPKLVENADDVFGSFEACEALALGILGKAALWDALALAFGREETEVDFKRLKERALDQHAVVEKLRLNLAAVAFGAAKSGR
jgi:hypothetical protein